MAHTHPVDDGKGNAALGGSEKEVIGLVIIVEERPGRWSIEMIGDVGGSFRYDREHLIDSVGRAAQRVVETYNKSVEAEKIAESAQLAVAGTAMVEIGAIGLGAIVTVLATTAAADVTGILAASVIATLGLFVIPARNAPVGIYAITFDKEGLGFLLRQINNHRFS